MMADVTDENRLLHQIQNDYSSFLNDGAVDGHGPNIDKIKAMIAEKQQRLYVNINDLRENNVERCIGLVEDGFKEMPLFQKALREVVATIDGEYANSFEEFYIGLVGSFGSKHVTPRTLTSLFLGSTVCVEGIVTKCTLVNPKIVRSFHYCPATKKTSEHRYTDVSSYDAIPSTNIYPTTDDDGNLLETEYGSSTYRDHQTITIQEMPEKAPTGQLPRSLEIILDNDLVDLCKPGDRVLIVGVYRCLPGKQDGFTTGVFKAILLASNVTLMHKDVNLNIPRDETAVIRKFAKMPNIFNLISKSLAPSIHGHDYIKKALLCLLLGGVEKSLPNGTRLRGDINILLIGDPSVAKSQMLRYVSNVGPRVVMTTGRGSSGVGLTAAVTTDHETGERRLEAGAMVLADRGIVCIDEFDKMSDADRTSIHEVMEQGKVTIAKAGIHARLNARTSCLAAANPLYGRYDSCKTPTENIGLQDSLLSRFDLLFILKDIANPESDRLIADHVLRMHRYRNPTEQDGEPTSIMQSDMVLTTENTDDQKKIKKLEPYEKHDPLLHGKSWRTRGDKVFSMEFIKKYLALAKIQEPKMTPEASRLIVEHYTTLRDKNETHRASHSQLVKTQPITARSLETMIRLSTAHAKARLSPYVTQEDTNVAIELIQYAIFEKVDLKDKKRRIGEDDYDSGNEEEMEGGENGAEVTLDANGSDIEETNPPKRLRTSNGHTDSDVDTPIEQEHVELMDVEDDHEAERGEISDQRYVDFKTAVSTLYEMEREQSLSKKKIIEWLTSPQQGFTGSEVLGGLDRLSEANDVIIEQGLVFLAT